MLLEVKVCNLLIDCIPFPSVTDIFMVWMLDASPKSDICIHRTCRTSYNLFVMLVRWHKYICANNPFIISSILNICSSMVYIISTNVNMYACITYLDLITQDIMFLMYMLSCKSVKRGVPLLPTTLFCIVLLILTIWPHKRDMQAVKKLNEFPQV